LIDPNKAVRTWLMANTTITDLVGSRIFCGVLPQSYSAEKDGLAITVKVRGGSAHEYVPLIRPSMQIECWGESLQYESVRELYAKVYDALHGYNMISVGDTVILSSIEEVEGQDSTDPDTGWASVVSFYRMEMREQTDPGVTGVVPGLVSSGRHLPLEALDGIRKSFTFVGIPSDPNKYLLMFNGQGIGSGFTQIGDVITFDTITPDASQNDELFCFY
jgi:hypothetical protein